MKVLYVTARWDPKNPDSGSGVNYKAYTFLKNYSEEIEIVGPFLDSPTIFERGIRKLAGLFSEKRFIKFYPSYIKYSNNVVQNTILEFQPDIIFSKSSVPLVNVDLPVPLVYMCDSSVKWIRQNLPIFSKLGFSVMENWERKVINKASHILTFSDANKKILINNYNKPEDRITVHPIPSTLSIKLCNFQNQKIKRGEQIKLLLVGKEFFGKGVDIAIKTAQILNKMNIPTELRVVGQNGVNTENIKFLGLLSKNNPNELEQFVNNYKWAHFLIFPSRFDAAGIVPSEAAGFGVPTITNAAGGLATTVKHNVSGIVLEKHSPAELYADVILYYLNNPQEYLLLRQSTYERYQSELNWDALGKKLIEIMNSLVKI